MKKIFTIQSEVWLYQGASGWYFITIPKEESLEIRSGFKNKSKAWGSIPVIVTRGITKWNTSIFPDKKSLCYLLPIKSEIRKKEKINAGDNIELNIRIL